ncbi:hypothetical protein CMUS01_05012 [Colletotrichum musicola]|uniref:Uncharacterized protein n=1 Tax=Colletotrichum musicola TaxID=2175873 RepID=A0A8H6KTP0_9PEZI|nr:hypothetical protein CMUS01_05012 [Colletotrichum musicola]
MMIRATTTGSGSKKPVGLAEAYREHGSGSFAFSVIRDSRPLAGSPGRLRGVTGLGPSGDERDSKLDRISHCLRSETRARPVSHSTADGGAGSAKDTSIFTLLGTHAYHCNFVTNLLLARLVELRERARDDASHKTLLVPAIWEPSSTARQPFLVDETTPWGSGAACLSTAATLLHPPSGSLVSVSHSITRSASELMPGAVLLPAGAYGLPGNSPEDGRWISWAAVTAPYGIGKLGDSRVKKSRWLHGCASVRLHDGQTVRWPGLLRKIILRTGKRQHIRKAARQRGAFDPFLRDGLLCAMVPNDSASAISTRSAAFSSELSQFALVGHTRDYTVRTMRLAT